MLPVYTNLHCGIQGIYFTLQNTSNFKIILGDQKKLNLNLQFFIPYYLSGGQANICTNHTRHWNAQDKVLFFFSPVRLLAL